MRELYKFKRARYRAYYDTSIAKYYICTHYNECSCVWGKKNEKFDLRTKPLGFKRPSSSRIQFIKINFVGPFRTEEERVAATAAGLIRLCPPIGSPQDKEDSDPKKTM